VAKGRRRQRRQFGWAVVVVGPGMIEPVAVPAGTVGGPRERWVEMQAVASLHGRWVCGQCW